MGLFSFVGVNQAFAAATLSLTPASGSVNEGSNITLEIYINTGGEILSEFIVVKEQDGLQTFGMLVSAAVITPSGINLTQLIGIVLVVAGVFAIVGVVLLRRKLFKKKETVTTTE